MRSVGRVAAVVVAAALVAVSAATAADDRPLTAGGVTVLAPGSWTRVVPASADSVIDPRTALVIGTRGVAARPSECQVAAYKIPADGAAVVVLAWRGVAADGIPRDRHELVAMRLRRPMFECWDGRGAVAQLALKGRAYQVNVMVGDKASRETIADALAIARSFGLAS
jgi:hypothetical protein